MSLFSELGELGIGAVFLILLVMAGLTGGVYYIYDWAAPKYEETRRQTYEESQSYVRGKIQHISRMKREYETVESKGQRASIRQIVLDEVASFDRSKLPPHLLEWVEDLEEQ